MTGPTAAPATPAGTADTASTPTPLTLVGEQGVVCEGDFCYLPSGEADPKGLDTPVRPLGSGVTTQVSSD